MEIDYIKEDIFKISVIDYDSELYPAKLKEISRPPKQLYCMGNLELLTRTSVAIVGSRRYTLYGKRTASMIAGMLVREGINVVSGMAIGIDSFAHEGALLEEGNTIAVLGCGIGKVFPARNIKLHNTIVEKGLVISEYPEGFQGAAYSFPARNRIISGISDIVVVVEAGAKSGSLITANFAGEQGKSLYAVPGNINSQFSIGTNMLIRDGAKPLVVISDLLEELEVSSDYRIPGLSKEHLKDDELEVLEAVERCEGSNYNEVAKMLGKKIEFVNSVLAILEIKGYVYTYCGKIHLAK